MGAKRISVIVACSILTASAHAGLIEVDPGMPNFWYTVYFSQPIGQTFTAEDAQIEHIALGVVDANPVEPVVPLTASLYEGIGDGGTLLGSVAVTPPAGIEADDPMVEFDFSSATLQVGQPYSVLLTTTNPRWGVSGYRPSSLGYDPYPGGTFYMGSGPMSDYEARFRVAPEGYSTIPEPASMGLLALGLIALRQAQGRPRKRRRRRR